nr:hypothetical protein [Thermoanaerobacterales bacterium]
MGVRHGRRGLVEPPGGHEARRPGGQVDRHAGAAAGADEGVDRLVEPRQAGLDVAQLDPRRGQEGLQAPPPEREARLGVGLDAPPGGPLGPGRLAHQQRGRRRQHLDDGDGVAVGGGAGERLEGGLALRRAEVADQHVQVVAERDRQQHDLEVEAHAHRRRRRAPRRRDRGVEQRRRLGDPAPVPAGDAERGQARHPHERDVGPLAEGVEPLGQGQRPLDVAPAVVGGPLGPQQAGQDLVVAGPPGQLDRPPQQRGAADAGVAVERPLQRQQPAGGGELGLDALGGAGGAAPELHRPLEHPLRRLEGEAPDRHLRGPLERLGRPLPDAHRRRGPQVLGQDLGGVVVVRRGRGDGVGDPQVRAGPAQGGDVVDHDLADQRVGEADRAGQLGHRDEQPLDDRRVEVVDHRVDVLARGPGQQRELDVPPDDGGHGEQALGRLRQPGQPAADDVAHARGHVAAR